MKKKWKVYFVLYKLHDRAWEYFFIRPLVALANWRMKRHGSNIRYRIYRESVGNRVKDEDLV